MDSKTDLPNFDAAAITRFVDGKWDDEIVKATALTRDGAVIHPSFAPKSAA